jgi:hypothetical protein
MLLQDKFGICSRFYLVLTGQSCQKGGIEDVISCQQLFCFVSKGLLNMYWNAEMGPRATIW